MPHQEIPWKQIYDLSLQCCKYRSTKSFSVSLLREMNRLVPFDEAVVFYLNGNLKITDYYLYNINPKWMSLYLGYYSKMNFKHIWLSVFTKIVILNILMITIKKKQLIILQK